MLTRPIEAKKVCIRNGTYPLSNTVSLSSLAAYQDTLLLTITTD